MIRSTIPVAILAPAFAAALLVLPACKPAAAPGDASASPTPASAATPAAMTNAASPEATPLEGASTGLELKDPVARVAGVDITKAQLEEAFAAAVQASGSKAEDLTPEQKLGGYRQILDELILDKLVAKAAEGEVISDEDINAEIAKLKKQFPTEEAFTEQLAQAGQSPEKLTGAMRTMLQQQRWMQSQIKDTDKVEDADVKTFYDANTAEFETPEQVKASHILFMVKKDDAEDVVKKQEKAAEKAAARAKKEDFTKLAKELSEEPGAKETGGDLGFFSKDRMVPEFAEVAFTQKPGEVGKPVRTQFGWHVIKVTEKKPAGTTPFEEVKDQVSAYLKSTKQREAVQGVLKGLKDSAQIETTLPPGN